ncbi:hypothetical protein IU427_00715 [Nocardia beijingensis]|uniref:Uncharacterized protein n=2 Tax=Nocardia TaxID=1817 RepID=A0ABV2X8G4_9NOCA|nr:hypothetical protein [Nocardia niwae]MBF6463699.1 hypothetical protein [Nocardia beijingensis]
MITKATQAIAATALVLAMGAFFAPAASAAPASPAPTTDALGSVAVCLNVPLGSVSISFCI